MDEVERTLATYEGDAEVYAEKYLSESGLEAYGGPFLDRLEGGRVLDLGCGPGVDTALFAQRGFDVVGFDVTGSFLRRARDHLADVTADRQAEASFVRGERMSPRTGRSTASGLRGRFTTCRARRRRTPPRHWFGCCGTAGAPTSR
jgi:SAM-dependent methyltransferase